jgi:hypothetical protein
MYYSSFLLFPLSFGTHEDKPFPFCPEGGTTESGKLVLR